MSVSTTLRTDSVTHDVPSDQDCAWHRQRMAPSCRYNHDGDDVLRESLVTALNIDLVDDRWSRALPPVRWGGLSMCSVVSPAPSAYMASTASTAEFMSPLLPTPLRDVADSGVKGGTKPLRL
jgi:hypothetical protein